MKEAPQLFSRYLAEAKGRRRNPHSWAREEAAKAVQKRMRELGVANPPAVTTIMKKWKVLVFGLLRDAVSKCPNFPEPGFSPRPDPIRRQPL